jgi:hypothetical protein
MGVFPSGKALLFQRACLSLSGSERTGGRFDEYKNSSRRQLLTSADYSTLSV